MHSVFEAAVNSDGIRVLACPILHIDQETKHHKVELNIRSLPNQWMPVKPLSGNVSGTASHEDIFRPVTNFLAQKQSRNATVSQSEVELAL